MSFYSSREEELINEMYILQTYGRLEFDGKTSIFKLWYTTTGIDQACIAYQGLHAMYQDVYRAIRSQVKQIEEGQ